MDEEFWRICSMHDITNMPTTIRLETTANIVTPKKPLRLETLGQEYRLSFGLK